MTISSVETTISNLHEDS